MLQINPKKFRKIENKSIPSPMRPKFRGKNETNIYFLSKRKFNTDKKKVLIKRIKITFSIIIFGLIGFLLSN